MILGVFRLNRTQALNPGWSPEGQALAWTLTKGFGEINVKSLSLKLSQVMFRHWLFGVASLLQTRQ